MHHDDLIDLAADQKTARLPLLSKQSIVCNGNLRCCELGFFIESEVITDVAPVAETKTYRASQLFGWRKPRIIGVYDRNS